MGHRNKDLLQLELRISSSSPIESALLVCDKKKSSLSQSSKPLTDEKPAISSVPESQVLGKVRDFLGVMEKANKRLDLDAKDNTKAYDIEVLNGNESEVIEMDLMLGVADLHTPEAVAAAESAIAGYQPVIPLAASSSGTESEGSSDDSEDSNDDDVDENDKEICSPMEVRKLKAGKDDSLSEGAGNNRSKKRTKIVVLT